MKNKRKSIMIATAITVGALYPFTAMAGTNAHAASGQTAHKTVQSRVSQSVVTNEDKSGIYGAIAKVLGVSKLSIKQQIQGGTRVADLARNAGVSMNYLIKGVKQDLARQLAECV